MVGLRMDAAFGRRRRCGGPHGSGGGGGRLTDHPGDLSVVGGQLVADGRGGFISIGGDEQGLQSADNGLSDLLRLDMGRPNTSLSFVRTGDLPAQDTVNGETVSGLAGHTVTRLTAAHQFQDWLLVAGGSRGLNGSSTVTDRASVGSRRRRDGQPRRRWKLPEGVYHHTADEFGAGFMAIIGGAVGHGATVWFRTTVPAQSVGSRLRATVEGD